MTDFTHDIALIKTVTMLKLFYVNKVNFKLSYNVCEVHFYFQVEISYFK